MQSSFVPIDDTVRRRMDEEVEGGATREKKGGGEGTRGWRVGVALYALWHVGETKEARQHGHSRINVSVLIVNS